MQYDDLVKAIESIATLFPAPRLPLSPESGWTPIYVEASTAKSPHTQNRRVIVCVGANYLTEPTQYIPASKPNYYSKLSPGVEDSDGRLRSNVKRYLGALHSSTSKGQIPVWRGMLPFDPCMMPIIKRTLGELAESQDCHIVMTNLSPWSTLIDWADIRDPGLENIHDLLSRPGGVFHILDFLKAIKTSLPKDTIWIGHGSNEIYGLFTHLCLHTTLNIRDWLFSSNLSQRQLFGARNTTNTILHVESPR